MSAAILGALILLIVPLFALCGCARSRRHEAAGGGSKEYSAYQRLVTEQQITQERLRAEEDAMNWALWGPW